MKTLIFAAAILLGGTTASLAVMKCAPGERYPQCGMTEETGRIQPSKKPPIGYSKGRAIEDRGPIRGTGRSGGPQRFEGGNSGKPGGKRI